MRSDFALNIALTSLLSAALMAPVLSHAEGDTDRKNPIAFVKDSSITTKVKAKLAAEKLSSLATIHVDTDANGVVYLTGTARTQEQIDKAISIASGTERVRSVKSQLTVKKDD